MVDGYRTCFQFVSSNTVNGQIRVQADFQRCVITLANFLNGDVFLRRLTVNFSIPTFNLNKFIQFSRDFFAVLITQAELAISIFTVINDGCCSLTIAINDGYSMSTIFVIFDISFGILTRITFGTIFNDGCCSLTIAINDGYSMSTIVVLFNFGFGILTVCNDGRSSFTVTISNGYSMSTVAVVLNIGFGVLTIFTFSASSTSITFVTFIALDAFIALVTFNTLVTFIAFVAFDAFIALVTFGTGITFSTSCTVFNDGSSGITVTVFDGYSMSTVAIVFNFSFQSFLPSLTIVVVVLPSPSVIVTV